MMKRTISVLIIGLLLSGAVSCSGGKRKTQTGSAGSDRNTEFLKDSLTRITGEYPGEIGIALLTGCGDTVVVNNEDKYPLMSVFKLHQAISLCHLFEKRNIPLDTIVEISRDSLNPDTWSPMLKDYDGKKILIPVSQLLRYTLMQSDNNASNYLFDNIESVRDVYGYISTLIPPESFRLEVTESEMWSEHSRSYDNHTSPLGAAILMNRIFTDSILSTGNTDFIRSTLRACRTGGDRIVAPISGIDGITVGHKTGSGFRDGRGRLIAHNDVAFVALPDGRYYTLAVFVKDFDGNEEEASAATARISAVVYSYITSGPFCRADTLRQ